MGQKIAFRPHQTRGQEIIRILENMGFRNPSKYDGNCSESITKDYAFIGGCDGAEDCIILTDIVYLENIGYKICTLEEYEEEMKKSEATIEPSMVKLDDVCDWIQKNMTKYVKHKTSMGENGAIDIYIISYDLDMVRNLRKAMEK